MMRRLLLIAAAAPSLALAAEGLVTLQAGVDHSSGEYGKVETTDVSTAYFSAKYDQQRWGARVVIPYVRISGPASVVGIGPDAIVLPGEAEGRRTATGLGDIYMSGTFKALTDPAGPLQLDLVAKVKLGTADENEGLGTGKNDYSVQADVFKAFGAFTPFVSLGYRWYGDPPGVDLRNVVFGTVGFTWLDSSGTTLGAAYDYRDHNIAGGARGSELSLFLSHPLGPQWKAQLYFVKGFSDASPDAGVGAVLGYSY